MSAFDTILRNQHFINGQWKTGKGNKITVLNKFSGEIISSFNYADEDLMEEAIAAASEAFLNYRNVSAGKRKDLLKQIGRGLEKRFDEFVSLIVAEAGKPVDYARIEVERALQTINAAAEEATRMGGELVPMDFSGGEGKTAFTKRFPVGPVAAISPFNFPLNLAMHKIAPALASGCTIVLKPPHQSPLTCLAFGKIIEEAGVPAGVVNILLSDIDVAEKLVKDERMKLLSFTGSDKVGWHLKNIAGKKKVLLELGGNAAILIDETVDLKKITPVIVNGTYNYAGQVCISTQRIYVLEYVFDELKNLLITEIKKLKSGDPSEAGIVNGPIISPEHVNRIESWIDEAVNQGAEILTGGKVLPGKNNLFAPTLLTNTNDEMKIITEEAFGPVASIESVKSFNEGLDRINNSKFGLQAGIFTNNITRMKHAFNVLEVGAVIMNNVPAFRIDTMPYGGIKASGLGREGVKYAMEDMTEPKLIIF
ncbi:MAG: aldehyde dehydrogenase family protein [Bacteroidia bacterium]